MKKSTLQQKIIQGRLNVVYRIITTCLRPIFRIFYNYKCDKPKKIKGPVIVLANHVTDYDPILVTYGFKKQMYFIASENCFRKGLKSKFLSWAFAPISKIKGASDTMAVMKAVRYLKEGKNICIFPEGGRTFNGKTTPVQVATGKLVKLSGASLATFKISGGYFKIPRWGYGFRKGPWSGKHMGLYSPEQLKAMSAQEITDLINRDLYEDAYETQAKNPSKYFCDTPALGMECGVSVCPSCKSIDKIKTDSHSVFCTCCNLKTTIDEYGYFEEGFPFHTFSDWDSWQENYYKEYTATFADNTKPIIFDENVNLRTVNADHETIIIGNGTFALYKDRFSFKPTDKDEVNLSIDKVPDCSVFSRSNFNFTDNEGLHYELYTDRLINVRKYLSVWNYLREQNN